MVSSNFASFDRPTKADVLLSFTIIEKTVQKVWIHFGSSSNRAVDILFRRVYGVEGLQDSPIIRSVDLLYPKVVHQVKSTIMGPFW